MNSLYISYTLKKNADTLVEGTTRSTQRERARPPPSKQRMSTWGPTTFCHGKSLRHNGKVSCVRRRVYRVGVMESATYHLKTVMMASSRIEDLGVTLLLKPPFSILTPAYISGDPGTGLSLKATECSQRPWVLPH